jgi:hypothetical protein
MLRLNRFSSTLTRAQRAVTAPVRMSSQKATVISRSKAGLYKNVLDISVFKLTVETSEQPGQPLELWGQASIAEPLSKLEVGQLISFSGTVQGSIGRGRRPHVVVNSFDVL